MGLYSNKTLEAMLFIHFHYRLQNASIMHTWKPHWLFYIAFLLLDNLPYLLLFNQIHYLLLRKEGTSFKELFLNINNWMLIKTKPTHNNYLPAVNKTLHTWSTTNVLSSTLVRHRESHAVCSILVSWAQLFQAYNSSSIFRVSSSINNFPRYIITWRWHRHLH